MGISAGPPDGNEEHLISLPGRSPVLDVAQLGVLRGYGSEREVAADDVLFRWPSASPSNAFRRRALPRPSVGSHLTEDRVAKSGP